MERKICVCARCLQAIESKEGRQAVSRVYIDEGGENESRCGWCLESGFDELFELV